MGPFARLNLRAPLRPILRIYCDSVARLKPQSDLAFVWFGLALGWYGIVWYGVVRYGVGPATPRPF